MAKAPSRSSLSKAAVDAWSKLVRARANHICEWCGEPARDAHHMVGRRKGNNMKFSLANGVALCKGCHMNFHDRDSSEGWEKFKAQRPEDYELVQATKNVMLKLSLDDLRDMRLRFVSMLGDFE